MPFKFKLKTRMTIKESGEEGEVIGRADYSAKIENNYLLRYKAADGRATEAWWTESSLQTPEAYAEANPPKPKSAIPGLFKK